MVMAVEPGEYVVHLQATKNRTPDPTHRAPWIDPQSKAAWLQRSTALAPEAMPALFASLPAEFPAIVASLADHDLDACGIRAIKRRIRRHEALVTILAPGTEQNPRDLALDLII